MGNSCNSRKSESELRAYAEVLHGEGCPIQAINCFWRTIRQLESNEATELQAGQKKVRLDLPSTISNSTALTMDNVSVLSSAKSVHSGKSASAAEPKLAAPVPRTVSSPASLASPVVLKEANIVTVSRDGIRVWNREGVQVVLLPCPPSRTDADIRHCTILDPYIVAAQAEALLVWNVATGGAARVRLGHQAPIVGFATGPLLPSEKGPYLFPTLLSTCILLR